MKKRLVIVLCLCMTLALCACGSGSFGSPAPAASSEPSTDSDKEYVKANGKLVIGVTAFEPMDYQDADGNWIGFDAEMAKAFAESLGVTAEFVEISWENRILELNNKGIDCIWNGMTLTDEARAETSCSKPYMRSAQVIVVPVEKAASYANIEEMSDLIFAVEAGSAGEMTAKDLGYASKSYSKQAEVLTAVSAGTADAAIVDLLFGLSKVGEGRQFADLAYTFSLSEEQCAVAMRSDSDLTDAVNAFLKTQYDNGTMDRIAVTYGLGGNIIAQ